MPQITKKTTLAELMDNSKAVEILKKYNLPCLGCPFAKLEMENLRIGDICRAYEIDADSLTRELNRVCKIKSK